MSDRIFGGLGMLLAAFYIWQATLIQESFVSDPIGPKTFPIIIGAVLGISSLVILLRPDGDPVWPAAPRFLEISMAAAVMIAYAMMLPSIGFVIPTAVVSAYLAWRLGASIPASVIAGIAISIGIYVIFHLILGLSLARGILGF
ncbi:tripartite tricarboxylate transporter TctB family protein [Pararhizobium mangrovi]|uniref:Tripartite tricarboxylate transporter TctB family protein n=1 Tax=Pararhizobium mangrovi TaxID=2590452 RepID=A0A506U0W1_9HYPH|nr:tripartite tricarboxylate transporter TctB family protein [Pararhizobium mangrovi]TPW26249.1 tripartite tricarboxylate transporter TctB family protein [Pararhizobium mangrovi]